ncbi:hypothetical protein C0991_006271, partial [Blastosporella zonata]
SKAVVTGTGAQGRAVSRAFHNTGLWHVRVLTRDPTGEVATTFKNEGMEIIQADFEDKTSLLQAFKGAYAVFSVTIPAWHQKYTNKLGEYEQGTMQADAAKESNVQFILFSTLPYVGPDYMGLGGVELYDAKARTNDYITSIDLPGVYLGTPAFVDNVHSWPLVKEVDSGARLESTLRAPLEPYDSAYGFLAGNMGRGIARNPETDRDRDAPYCDVSQHPEISSLDANAETDLMQIKDGTMNSRRPSSIRTIMDYIRPSLSQPRRLLISE